MTRPLTFNQAMNTESAGALRSLVAKRDGEVSIRKDIPSDIATWLPEGLDALVLVVAAAIEGVPPELEASVTPEIRLQAVRASATQFTDELLQRVAQVIVMATPAASVAKRRASLFRGLL